MSPLLFSVSGLRGIVGEDLTPFEVIKYTSAFCRANGGDLYIVGQDTRPHSAMVKYTVISSLLASGKTVIDIGVVPTPTLLFFVRHKNADGGIMVTASHNPVKWNALKFVKKGGVFTVKEDVEKIKKFLDESHFTSWNNVKNVHLNLHAIEDHIDRILEHPFVEIDKIRQRRFKVAVDCVNGAAYRAIPLLLEKLNCKVIKLNCEPTGIFPHNPEPKRENLKELDEILLKNKANIGFATDPDGDRLVVGIGGIGVLSEEYTVPLAAYHVLGHRKGPVVVNLSTSMLIEDVVSRFKVKVHRTPVGEANVVEEMTKTDAVIGGEGNGGVIFPEINSTRDSLTGIALILSLAAKKDIKNIISELPEYFMKKVRIDFEGELPINELKNTFKRAKIDTRDGIHFRFKKSWLHVRKSNTEPIVRIYAEARTEKEVDELVNRAKDVLKC